MDPSLVAVVHQAAVDAEDVDAGLDGDAREDENEGVGAVVDDAVAD
jgi:hypothetical protein